MSVSSDFPKKNRLKAQARQKSEPMDKAAGKYIFLSLVLRKKHVVRMRYPSPLKS